MLGLLLCVSPCQPTPEPLEPPTCTTEVELPPSSYTADCEAHCATAPGDAPRVVSPADPCPDGICQRRIQLAFHGERLQVELGGRIYTESTALVRWTGPLALQAYDVRGNTFRCTGAVGPGTGALVVRGQRTPSGDWGLRLEQRPEQTSEDCTLVRESSSWDVASVARPDEAALDAALASLRASKLLGERWKDDAAVTTALHQSRALPSGSSLWRRRPDSTVASGGAVVVYAIPMDDLEHKVVGERRYCNPFCSFDHRFTGTLRSTTTAVLHDAGEERFCDRWRELSERRFAARQDGQLVAVFELPDRCTPTWTFATRHPRVPFSEPRTLDPAPGRATARAEGAWPRAGGSHPVAASVPAGFTTSVERLGSYLAVAEPEPVARLEAVHDWVATHIAYDVASLDPEQRAPQDAATVFTTRQAVCSGYANLVVALAGAAGIEAVVVNGHVRDRYGVRSPIGHAWNAARVDGRWLLLDATWDAGGVDERGFVAELGSRYLFPPPEVMAVDHLPADPRWQLLDEPVSTEVFARRPALSGGVVLLEPTTDALWVDSSELTVSVASPDGDVQMAWRALHDPRSGPCEVAAGAVARGRCVLPGPGAYAVDLLVGERLVGVLSVRK